MARLIVLFPVAFAAIFSPANAANVADLNREGHAVDQGQPVTLRLHSLTIQCVCCGGGTRRRCSGDRPRHATPPRLYLLPFEMSESWPVRLSIFRRFRSCS